MNRFSKGSAICVAMILIFVLPFILDFTLEARVSKVIALTFDDGPKAEVLKDLLPLLARYNIKATFFVNGYRFERNKINAQYIAESAAKGHSIQNHTFYHRDFKTMDKKYGRQELLNDINKNSEFIKKYAGEKPTFLRPPYEIIWPELKKDIENLGYNIVDLNTDIDSVDYRLAFTNQGRKRIISNILKAIKKRESEQKFYHILLFHELKGTVKALPELIEFLRKQGYEFDVVENVYPYLK